MADHYVKVWETAHPERGPRFVPEAYLRLYPQVFQATDPSTTPPSQEPASASPDVKHTLNPGNSGNPKKGK